LDQLGKVATKEEAAKLTEVFLERYKGTFFKPLITK
jgi:hypothetical protein